MNESKVVIYKVFPTHLHGKDLPYASPVNVVTHADYKALEDDHAELRGSYEAEYARSRKLEDELAALRGKVRELVASWDEFYAGVETIEGPEGMDARVIAARKAFP